jgi:hypothetical protein
VIVKKLGTSGLSPYQFGFESCATECVQMLVQQKMGFLREQADRVVFDTDDADRVLEDHEARTLFSWDFSMAFQCVDRSKLEALLHNVEPGLVRLFRYFYGRDTPLYLRVIDGVVRFVSSDGVQQGAGLSGWFFSIALTSMINKLHAHPFVAFVAGYFDDGYGGIRKDAPADALQIVLALVKEEAFAIGLMMNDGKTRVAERKALLDGTYVGAKGEKVFNVLGAPLGQKQHVREWIQNKGKVLSEQVNMYSKLSKQAQLMLLRKCAHAKLRHIIRSADTRENGDVLTEIDDTIANTVGRLGAHTHKLTPAERDRIKLPISHGGLGLTSLTETAEPARAAAIVQAAATLNDRGDLHLDVPATAITVVKESMPTLTDAQIKDPTADLARKLQRKLTTMVHNRVVGRLYNGGQNSTGHVASLNAGQRARMAATVNTWVDAPCGSLRDVEIAHGISMAAGCEVVSRRDGSNSGACRDPKQCNGAADCDAFTHLYHCKQRAHLMTHLHTHTNHALKTAATACLFVARVEPTLTRAANAPANQGACRADLELTDSTPNPILVDVSGVSVPKLGCTCLNLTASLQGIADCRENCIMPGLLKRDAEKDFKYTVKFKLEKDIKVVPFVYSPLGVLAPRAYSLMRTMAEHRMKARCERKSLALMVVTATVAAALLRQHARNMSDTHGSIEQMWAPLE